MKIIPFIFIFFIKMANASTLFVPDSDTGLLIALASNTAQQLTRLEQLVSETDKHTKLFRESVEMVEERYEVVEQLQSMASNYAQLASSNPQNITELNDLIEELNNQKERLKELIKKSKVAGLESDKIKSENQNIDKIVHSDNLVAKKQIAKSFGAGKNFSKNIERVNAQNTSLILKETVSLNGAINTTNGLMATQNSLTKIQVDQIIQDNISKDNAFKPIPKGKKL